MQIDWKPRAAAGHEWRRPVRWLHFGLALTITLQLFNSLVMSPPFYRHASAFGLGLFGMHEYLGLLAAAIVVLHWLWMPFDRQRLFSHLFPWGAQGRRDVMDDLRTLAQGQLPGESDRGGLSGLVHGLGLLAATGAGLTGVLLYVLMGASSAPALLLYLSAELHSAFGNLMWGYLGGHVLLATVHHLIGHPTLKRMFSW
ncbi:MAG: cytochrome b/b6 domain-containing protein [Acidihalobacter sp.]|jgi:cytochrome b561